MRHAVILCGAVLIASLARAAEPLQLGAETNLLPDGPGDGFQRGPHVAFGDDIYLAVWQEGWHGEGGRARIYAARLSPAGRLLDPRGSEVSAMETTGAEHPRVAYAEGTFLVVWQELRDNKDVDVLGQRLDASGKPLDDKPLVVAGGPGSQALPDVASDGHDFLVAWQSFDPQENTYRGEARRVSPKGELGRIVATGAAPRPRLAFSGDCYLAVFGGDRAACVKLDRDGKPLNPSKWGNLIVGNIRSPLPTVCAAGERGWLVVVHRSLPDYWGWGGPGGIRCYLITSEGKLDPTLAEPMKRDQAGNWGRLPHWLDVGGQKATTWPWGECAATWDGQHTVVVWQRHQLVERVMLENTDLYAGRLDGWQPLDREGVVTATGPTNEQAPALASDGQGRLLCVYEKHQPVGRVNIVARSMQTKRARP